MFGKTIAVLYLLSNIDSQIGNINSISNSIIINDSDVKIENIQEDEENPNWEHIGYTIKLFDNKNKKTIYYFVPLYFLNLQGDQAMHNNNITAYGSISLDCPLNKGRISIPNTINLNFKNISGRDVYPLYKPSNK